MSAAGSETIYFTLRSIKRTTVSSCLPIKKYNVNIRIADRYGLAFEEVKCKLKTRYFRLHNILLLS
jgi:hypothetical protein